MKLDILECDNPGREVVYNQETSGYDMPEISYRMSETSSYSSFQITSQIPPGYKREHVIQNPYYGVS